MEVWPNNTKSTSSNGLSVGCHQIQDSEEFFKSPEGAKFVKKQETNSERGLEMEAKEEAKEEGEEMEEDSTTSIAECWLKAKKFLLYCMISIQYQKMFQSWGPSHVQWPMSQVHTCDTFYILDSNNWRVVFPKTNCNFQIMWGCKHCSNWVGHGLSGPDCWSWSDGANKGQIHQM